MGTNYYFYPNGRLPCGSCGRPAERLLLGRSAAGWAFLLRAHPDREIWTLDDWRARWEEGGEIADEYGHKVSAGELLARILDRIRAGPDGGPVLHFTRENCGPFLDPSGYSVSPTGQSYDITTNDF